MTRHRYQVTVTWTGNTGVGTTSARAYERAHEITAEGPPPILGSSDPAFRGDPGRWNPEQLYVAAISECHMLWYLDLAARAGIVVTAYRDRPTAVMVEESDGAGRFERVVLHPTVTVTRGSDPIAAARIHDQVGDYCFIARSVATPIEHEVTVLRG